MIVAAKLLAAWLAAFTGSWRCRASPPRWLLGVRSGN